MPGQSIDAVHDKPKEALKERENGFYMWRMFFGADMSHNSKQCGCGITTVGREERTSERSGL